MDLKKRSSFKGSIGFVMAAAASAVGLGNIWRFPYLAARDGGGLFLIIYIVLAFTFGFTLLTTEVAIGRKTKQSPLTAYGSLRKRSKFLGVIACVIPFLIMPYYCVIGGWVVKYLVVFVTGRGLEAAQEGYFSNFITGQSEPIIYMLIFMLICAFIVFRGVSGGIEKYSRILMPILLILVLGIAIFSLTVKSTAPDGSVVTGMQGLKFYLIPNFEGISLRAFFRIVMDALGQLFYSLSVAMGIMIAYGSYVPDDANLTKSIRQIEIMDTVVAFLAGVMIIPAVYVFSGTEGMAAGPSLIFISLPKIFLEMGPVGNVIGALFFAMLTFAAITSAMSILEAVVSSLMDRFHMSRGKSTLTETVIAGVIGLIVCFGYNIIYFEYQLPNGSVGQVLDILDYISNLVLMPLLAIGTCILIGWVLKPKTVIDEVTKNGERFSRKKMYSVMIKFIAPALLVVLFLISIGIL